MSDDDGERVRRLTTRVVSDGNGGLQLKEPVIELLRKWLSPILLGVVAWAGKGIVQELIALHDGQLRLEAKVINVANDVTHAAQDATAARSQGQANADAIREVGRDVERLRRRQ